MSVPDTLISLVYQEWPLPKWLFKLEILKFDILQIFKIKIIIILSFNADTISYFRTNFTLILFIRLNCIKMTPCFCINWFRIFYIVFFSHFQQFQNRLILCRYRHLKLEFGGQIFDCYSDQLHSFGRFFECFDYLNFEMV
jgi:hypothetical protein